MSSGVISSDVGEGLRLSTGRGRWVLTATVLGSSMAMLDATVVGIAQPAIGKDFHTDIAGLQWVSVGYLLSLAGLLLLAGGLCDRFGRRRVFLIGVAWFAIASLICATAPSIELLIAARVLQGIGGALLTPGSLAILEASFVPMERGRVIGAWSGLGGVATAIGPPLGGFLITALSWRLIFLINAPIALAVILISLRHVPESRDPDATGAIDVAGQRAHRRGAGRRLVRAHRGDRRGMGLGRSHRRARRWRRRTGALRPRRAARSRADCSVDDLPLHAVQCDQCRDAAGLCGPGRDPVPASDRAAAGRALQPDRRRRNVHSHHGADARALLAIRSALCAHRPAPADVRGPAHGGRRRAHAGAYRFRRQLPPRGSPGGAGVRARPLDDGRAADRHRAVLGAGGAHRSRISGEQHRRANGQPAGRRAASRRPRASPATATCIPRCSSRGSGTRRSSQPRSVRPAAWSPRSRFEITSSGHRPVHIR